jgi:DNA-binding GntR family transcriptional regulator
VQEVAVTVTGDQTTGGQHVGDDWVAAVVVHRGSFVPLHRQIHDAVREEIVAGRLAPGARLPSEGDLAGRWGVSLAPVRQALVDLAAEGYLDRVRGRGTVVRPSKFAQKLSILSSFSESQGQHGQRPKVVMLYSGRVPAPPEVAAALGVRTRKLVLIQRLAYLEASPVALLCAYLDPGRFPGIEKAELDGGSLYRTFDTVYGVELVRADSVIEAVHATDDEAAPLGVATGAMVLRADSVTYDRQDAPVEYSRVLYRVERFRFSLESHRYDDRILHFPSPVATDKARGDD